MDKDAVSAGVGIGGLFSTAEIRILICYILTSINQPVPGRMLGEVFHFEGIANCFEVNDAIASLCKSGQISVFDEKEDTYIITDSGRSIAGTLNTSLSFTVKNRAYTAAIRMVSRFRNAKETDISVSREGDKTFITCSVLDSGQPFMSVKLLVTDEAQALCIKDKFLNDPAAVCSGIVELLTK